MAAGTANKSTPNGWQESFVSTCAYGAERGKHHLNQINVKMLT